MQKLSLSLKVYLVLIIIYSILNAVYIYLPFPGAIPDTAYPAPKILIALVNAFVVGFLLYGGMGLIGNKMAEKFGFTKIVDKDVTNKQRFLIPLGVGVGCGVVIIILDYIFALINGLGRLPHPSFPTSLVASMQAGIGEEILFRLLFIPFGIWVLTKLFKKLSVNSAFLIMVGYSAIVFSFSHLPTVMFLYNLSSPAQIPPILYLELLLLNGLISIPAALYFKKYGFLAAVGIHFWTDIVWHVLYGLV